jgi:hypothetical protein
MPERGEQMDESGSTIDKAKQAGLSKKRSTPGS